MRVVSEVLLNRHEHGPPLIHLGPVPKVLFGIAMQLADGGHVQDRTTRNCFYLPFGRDFEITKKRAGLVIL